MPLGGSEQVLSVNDASSNFNEWGVDDLKDARESVNDAFDCFDPETFKEALSDPEKLADLVARSPDQLQASVSCSSLFELVDSDGIDAPAQGTSLISSGSTRMMRSAPVEDFGDGLEDVEADLLLAEDCIDSAYPARPEATRISSRPSSWISE